MSENEKDQAPQVECHRCTVPGPVRRFGVDTGLFFVLYYLYVWLVLDPRLIAHAIGIITPYYPFSFTAGWPFFMEHLAEPGGATDYAARYLTALYAVGWLGALIVTAAAWSLCLGIDLMTGLAGRPRGMLVRYVPAVLMLVVYNGHGHPVKAVLPLLVALLFFALYLRMAAGTAARASLLLTAICTVAYYVAGAGSLLLPVLAVIHELLITRRKLVALTALLSGLAVPWLLGIAVFDLPWTNAYGGSLIRASGGISTWTGRCCVGLYLLFPAVLAGATACRVLSARRASRDSGRASPGTRALWMPAISHFFSWGESRWIMKVAAVWLSAGAVVWFTSDPGYRIVLQMDYYCAHEMWPEVLEAADRMPRGSYNARCNQNMMLALCHTGRVGDEMFRYPQRMADDSFRMRSMAKDPHTYLQASRYFWGTGQVNQAELCAYESLLMTGDLPWILHHLALINIVKDRPEAAKVFLKALSKKPLHGRVATEMLRSLEEDPRLEGDARLRQIRRFMPKDDTAPLAVNYEEDLAACVEKNPDNEIALNFLMAYYLRTANPEKVVENLRYFDDQKSGSLPRHYQEAIVVYLTGHAGGAPSLESRVAPETRMRGSAFLELLAGTSNPEEALEKAVEAGFGDSYFFYHIFGASGL
ncbi:MAG: hypothetical protein GXX96_20675 [Planctomycetaceae bacterium]|nr:hypothetical protein [Planctomycetaceae bacterium]